MSGLSRKTELAVNRQNFLGNTKISIQSIDGKQWVDAWKICGLANIDINELMEKVIESSYYKGKYRYLPQPWLMLEIVPPVLKSLSIRPDMPAYKTIQEIIEYAEDILNPKQEVRALSFKDMPEDVFHELIRRYTFGIQKLQELETEVDNYKSKVKTIETLEKNNDGFIGFEAARKLLIEKDIHEFKRCEFTDFLSQNGLCWFTKRQILKKDKKNGFYYTPTKYAIDEKLIATEPYQLNDHSRIQYGLSIKGLNLLIYELQSRQRTVKPSLQGSSK